MMKKTLFVAITFIFAMVTFLKAQPAGMLQPLPIDSNVRVGVLPNGLTYYIRHNDVPKNRCEFHIAQKVGAILENDDQNGLAHFLEHMAFNGTKHFPGKGIINYFQEQGLSFGGDINAYTALDQTVYRLSNVPTARKGVLDSALLVLHDWSCGLSLLDSEIDDERGVIMGEWRQRAGADRRMWKEANKQMYAGSQYAKRDVIGDTAVIQHCHHNALRRYYTKWYGPDLQGIFVIGDVNVDSMDAEIKKVFGPIPARVNRGERPLYYLTQNDTPIVSEVTDKEAQYTEINVICKHKTLTPEQQESIIGYQKSLIDNLISMIMGYRFNELKMKPDASFIFAAVGYGSLVKTSDAFQSLIIPKEGRELQAYKDLLTEIQRMVRYGFTDSELERAKKDMLKSYEKSYNERNKRTNDSYTQEYIRNFLDNEPIPGITWEYDYVKQLLPQIHANILNQVAKTYITDNNIILAFQGNEKAAANFPSKVDAIKLFDNSKTEKIDAPKDETVKKPLVETTPKKGVIRKERYNKALGTTEWILENGIKVVIKPTTFKDDEILMSGYSQGGTSVEQDVSKLPSDEFATTVVGVSGLGNLSKLDLQKTLTGKIASVTPNISTYTEGFKGNSSVSDFETMLQLLYLNFTAPRLDSNAVKVTMDMVRTSLVNQQANPRVAFNDSIQMLASNHSPRTILADTSILHKIDPQQSLSFFKHRFANPADFIFTFTGNINPADQATKDAICTWLGGLKTSKVKEKFVDNGVREPVGKVTNDFSRDMLTTNTSNRVTFTGKMAYNLTNRINMRAISDILDIRYTESMREREGGTYGVSTAGILSNHPNDRATLIIQFDSDPAKEDILMGLVYAEIDSIIKNGPKIEDLEKTKLNFKKDLAQNNNENSYWDKTILYRYYIENVDYIKEYEKAIDALTPESIQNTLKKLVGQGNVMEVVMTATKK